MSQISFIPYIIPLAACRPIYLIIYGLKLIFYTCYTNALYSVKTPPLLWIGVRVRVKLKVRVRVRAKVFRVSVPPNPKP